MLPEPYVDQIPANWPRYQVYGITLASEFRFLNQLTASGRPADIRFQVVDTPDHPREEWGPALRSERDQWALHRVGATDILHFVDEADFFLSPGRIACFLPDPSMTHIAEIRLLGGVLAYWLELHGVPALHASAVVVDGRALAFVAGNGGGKSSLAAELLQRGYGLLTDDILPIELRNGSVYGLPGYPQMRMWPREAEHFLGQASRFGLAHPGFDKLRIPVGPKGIGSFTPTPTELGCVYLLFGDDEAEGPTLEQVPSSEAVVRIAEACFAAALAGAAPDQAGRLRLLGEIASRVPVRWLTLPPGTTRSPHIADAVLRDFEAQSRLRGPG